MAVTKKGDTTTTSADTTTTMTMPSQDEAAAAQGVAANSDDISINTIANGQHEVNLLDLGISAEDITVMRRVDARLEEVRRANRKALQEGAVEPRMITIVKGKETVLTKAER
jgi:activator of HSP90 ATPase